MSNTLANGLARYIYGTTRLGDEAIPFDERVDVARQAIDQNQWIHTSHQYGEALKVLRVAIDKNRETLPKAIYKIGWESVSQIREQILLHLETLGLHKMDVGQLCLGGPMAEAMRTGGSEFEALNELKSEGLVDRFVVEVFPWTSAAPLEALKAGHLKTVVDAVIFYLNPLQRFVSDELWDELIATGFPIVAMRTVAGGSIKRLTEPNGGGAEYLRDRATEVLPIFEESGCESWTEFCIRFSLGYLQVLATVGSTSHPERLNEFIQLANSSSPLRADLQSRIESLQRKWWENVDRHAEPWTM